MEKVPCEVIRDLIPLVLDEAASEESGALVRAHAETCEPCRMLLGGEPAAASDEQNEVRTLKRLKGRLFGAMLAVLVIGIVSGTAMMDGITMFYNFILFPAVGAGAYFLLRKWSWIAPSVTFAAIFLRYFCAPGNMSIFEGVISGLLFGLICAAFSGVGLLIGFLLRFAFKKEGKPS